MLSTPGSAAGPGGGIVGKKGLRAHDGIRGGSHVEIRDRVCSIQRCTLARKEWIITVTLIVMVTAAARAATVIVLRCRERTEVVRGHLEESSAMPKTPGHRGGEPGNEQGKPAQHRAGRGETEQLRAAAQRPEAQDDTLPRAESIAHTSQYHRKGEKFLGCSRMQDLRGIGAGRLRSRSPSGDHGRGDAYPEGRAACQGPRVRWSSRITS